MPSLIEAFDWLITSYRQMDLTGVGTGPRCARLIVPFPYYLREPETLSYEIGYTLLMLTAECERRRRQHRRSNGGPEATQITRKLLKIDPLDPKSLVLLDRQDVREQFHDDLEHAVRLLIGGRRAERQNDDEVADWDTALRQRLERIAILCDEILYRPGLDANRIPLDEQLRITWREIWRCLYGDSKIADCIFPPPLPLHIYTSPFEIFLGIKRQPPPSD